MNRWLVTGAGGMLGRDLVSVLERRGAEVAGLRRTDLDITDQAAVRAALRHWQPDVVVNCAAWTAVDSAETREADALLTQADLLQFIRLFELLDCWDEKESRAQTM